MHGTRNRQMPDRTSTNPVGRVCGSLPMRQSSRLTKNVAISRLAVACSARPSHCLPSDHFCDHFNFYASAVRDLGNAEGASSVFTARAQHLGQQVACPVGHQVVLCIFRRRIHQTCQFYDTANPVEVPNRGLQGTKKVDGYSTCSSLSLGRGEPAPKLPDPGLTFSSSSVSA